MARRVGAFVGTGSDREAGEARVLGIGAWQGGEGGREERRVGGREERRVG